MIISSYIHVAANGIILFCIWLSSIPLYIWTTSSLSTLLKNRLILFIFSLVFFFFKLYNIVLVLPNIEMNPPQVYMCSPSWTLLPPSSPYHPSGLSQCTSPKHPVSCIEPGLATRFIHDIIHVSMPFSRNMVTITLCTKQQKRHWCVEQS